jgi:hypothetical protein
MHAWIQQEGFRVMRRQLAFAYFCGVALMAGGQAFAQAGGMCVGLGNPEMRTLITFAGEPSGSTAEAVVQ